MLSIHGDVYFMQQALKEAQKALEEGEIPVGAVIVCNNQIISKSYNQTELLTDVTAHAEIIAITSASSYLNSKYLNECTLYVTLEPCNMCAGALYWSQIGRVVFGAADEKRGFMINGRDMLHPKTKLEFGVLHEECSSLIKSFFNTLRETY